MSQISLKYVEIEELKVENQELKHEVIQNSEEKKKALSDRK